MHYNQLHTIMTLTYVSGWSKRSADEHWVIFFFQHIQNQLILTCLESNLKCSCTLRHLLWTTNV